ncbi:MAG: mercury resistance system periplasmic binding protein MerP [Betaproteobacteria bacterium]|nr:MAG: mercury resistance system periplasmic binding protein MerP [Betaproteobacteria bacterium]
MSQRSLFAAIALAAVAAAPHVSLAEQKTVVLSVPDMNCSACPITVRKALEKVAGVQNVKASLEPPEASVTFDDAKTSIEKLTEATRKAGYPSRVKAGK